MENVPYLDVRKLSSAELYILPKLICKLNMIPIKTHERFLYKSIIWLLNKMEI
jgi:hypothetical protein